MPKLSILFSLKSAEKYSQYHTKFGILFGTVNRIGKRERALVLGNEFGRILFTSVYLRTSER